MKPSYRADHVGSFLRPPELLAMRQRFQAGQLPLEELRAFEDQVILDLLRMQKEVGISIFSDGEVRRDMWATGFHEAVDGLAFVQTASAPAMVWHNPDGSEVREGSSSTAQIAATRLRLKHRITQHESQFLARHAPGPFKVTLPSPAVLSGMIYRDGTPGQFYGSEIEMMTDITQIMRSELEALSREGVPYIQMDEGFTRMVADGWRERVRGAGGDPDALLAAAIQAENACYSAVARDKTTIGMHLCRGNFRSRWALRGGYDAIAERVFSDLNVDRYLLEYDTERAGGFEPLRFVPKGKIVVLGLISTKSPALESEDAVLRRIEDASKHIPIEQLALSPQCGFASSKEGNLITADDQRKKLELTVKVANRVWKD